MPSDDMSGSEDGQVRSPTNENAFSGRDDDDDDNNNDDEDMEQDADSLDIKPPQAQVSRDSSGSSRRKEKSKDKKHSKERKHKDKYSEGGIRTVAAGGGEKDYRDHRERRNDADQQDDVRRTGAVAGEERYLQQRTGIYEKDKRDYAVASAAAATDKRYHHKHFERLAAGNYHHHTQDVHAQYHHQQQQHMQQYRRQEYYDNSGRRQDYHQQPPTDYHQQRYHHHQQQQQQQASYEASLNARQHKHHHHQHQQYELEKRTKYAASSHYDQPKDPESIEQDLRSRLLSKRHKYVKDDDDDENAGAGAVTGSGTINEANAYAEHHGRSNKLERHHKSSRRAKNREGQLSDGRSNEDGQYSRLSSHRKKHKKHKDRHEKRTAATSSAEEDEGEEDEAEVKVAAAEKRRTSSDDPELSARRAKLLAAEHEKEKRKEVSRVELEARRELMRTRNTGATSNNIVDILSPSAVAASVTAGLHIVKRKKQEYESSLEKIKRKRSKKSKETDEDDEQESEESGEEDNEDDAEDSEDDSNSSDDSEDDSASDSGGATDSDHSYYNSRHKNKKEVVSKQKTKRNKKHAEEDSGGDEDDDNEVTAVPESPVSVEEIKSSKHKSKRKKHAKMYSDEDVMEVVDLNKSGMNHSPRSESPITLSPSRSRTQSKSPKQRSRARRRRRASSSSSRSGSDRSHLASRSNSKTSYSYSISKSRSRSRSRSEERDMRANSRREELEKREKSSVDTKSKIEIPDDDDDEANVPPVLDDKGNPLPNYYPGVQGCRSVEEFQCLNRIEEGTYGVVYRAKDKRTNEIVALKRLKMEKEKEGFPITSLREINTLLKGQHPNIVTVREIVVGSNMDKIFIVMDYVEHDLKSLMETMKAKQQSFFPGEVKCLTQQLLKAVAHLHDNWILHRDLKTSNLLLSHKGILKVGDFGLAREYGSPLKKYTSLVVTLWYRAPELLLGSGEYSTPIDVWSVGCIFAEFLQMAPLFPGKSEVDEINRIFKELGTPNDKIWPGYSELPTVKSALSANSWFADYPVSSLRKHFSEKTTSTGIELLQGLLTYDPKQRLSADMALKHHYFKELPVPIDPSMFPTWPAKSELGARKALASSPKPPSGGSQFKQLGRDDIAGSGAGAGGGGGSGNKIISGIITGNKKSAASTGFVLNAGLDQRQLAMGPGFNLKF